MGGTLVPGLGYPVFAVIAEYTGYPIPGTEDLLVATNAYLWLLTRVAAQKVTTYTLVNPLIALLLGAVVLHEPLTSHTFVAAAIVLGGVGLVLFQNRMPKVSEQKRSVALPVGQEATARFPSP